MGSLANVHTAWINGAFVIYEKIKMRLVDAFGHNVHKYIEDFHHVILASSLLSGWTNTAVEAGTGTSTHIVQDETGGVLRFDAAADENDGLQSQLDGESFKFETDKPLYFGCRWNISEKTQSDAFIGLALTDTAILDSNPNDMVGFITHDADANLDYIVRAGGTGAAVDSGQDLVNDAFVVTEFYYDGAGGIHIFVDGLFIAKVSANISATELRASIAYLNGAGTMQHDGVEVDWVRVIQIH